MIDPCKLYEYWWYAGNRWSQWGGCIPPREAKPYPGEGYPDFLGGYGDGPFIVKRKESGTEILYCNGGRYARGGYICWEADDGFAWRNDRTSNGTKLDADEKYYHIFRIMTVERYKKIFKSWIDRGDAPKDFESESRLHDWWIWYSGHHNRVGGKSNAYQITDTGYEFYMQCVSGQRTSDDEVIVKKYLTNYNPWSIKIKPGQSMEDAIAEKFGPDWEKQLDKLREQKKRTGR